MANLNRRNLIKAGSAAVLMGLDHGVAAGLPVANIPILGVNCYDLLGEVLLSGNTDKLKSRLSFLLKFKVRFVRFSLLTESFFGSGVTMSQKSKYIHSLTEVLSLADECGMRVVPSLFWNYRQSALASGEGVSAWANPSSRTRTRAQEIVNWLLPYACGHSCVLMWEISNEMNSYADIAGSGGDLSAEDPRILSSSGLRDCLQSLALEVRKFDITKLITSGNDLPRRSAYSASQGKRWIDSPQEFGSSVTSLSPDPIGCASIHVYPIRHNRDLFPLATFEDATEWAVNACRKSNKKLFVGEFGIPRGRSIEAEKGLFLSCFRKVIASGVDYVALWVFDRNAKDTFNIAPGDYRIYQLEAIARMQS